MRCFIPMLLLCLASFIQAQPTATLSAKFPSEEPGSHFIGRDRSFYYALRMKGKPDKQAAFIDVRNRDTFEKDHSFQVFVPAESADEFRIQEFVVSDAALWMFYSFYLR